MSHHRQQLQIKIDIKIGITGNTGITGSLVPEHGEEVDAEAAAGTGEGAGAQGKM
jgi:hypothetical protein